MMNFLKNPCNIYLSFLTFYLIQGVMIPTGGTVFSQLILSCAMLMGIYYTVKTICLPNIPVYFTGLNMLFFMFIIYGILLLFSNHHYIIIFSWSEVPNSTFLKNIFLSLPNVYVFYYFSRKGYLTEKALKKWVIVFLASSVFRYIDNQMALLNMMQLKGVQTKEMTNNMGYLFVALMPTIAVFKDKVRIQYGILILCMAFIMMAMKRGAIIVGTIMLIYILYFNYKYNKNVSKRKVIVFSLFIIVAAYFITEYMLESSDYFMSRIEQTKEGNSSGRNALYERYWNHFKNETDIFKYLLGNGANATLGIGVNYAHNDWLEIAIDEGVLGLVIYCIYWFCFWRTIASIKYNITAKLVLTLTFISFLIMTVFSMSYTEYSIYSCSVFGYYLAHYKEKEQ
jgi:hypothetical protein